MMNPRASIPATLSTLPRPQWTTMRAVAVGDAPPLGRGLGPETGPQLLVPGLALLQHREDRGCDEDRRVGADRDADEHREGEVLQRHAAEEQERPDLQDHA